ncbi:MAG: thiamine pyrophosphate-dependent enzyme [Bacteroides sp.]|nr:thiamine pyrophosphate-dependent enzyme [Bacteroides sp.]
MSMKISEQLVKTLEENGVERIYAVTGDSLNAVNEAVSKSDKIQWVHVRHEETGAYAAGAEAQLSGKLACCAGSCGPGHVHLLNGLYDAHRSGAPVLAIASTIPTLQFGMEYFQETHTGKLFDDCSYYNEVANTPQQLSRMLQSAIQTSISRKGVSVIGLPGDLSQDASEHVNTSTHNYPVESSVCPSQEELELLARLLNESKKITLFCGMGCKDAHEELITLSSRLHAPVVYTFKSKMAIQYGMPNEVGMTGLLGMPSGYYSMHDSEVLLMLGTDFPYDAFIPEDVWTAQVDIRPERLGRRTKVDMGISGDIRTTLRALLPLLDQKAEDNFLQKQLHRYQKVRKQLDLFAGHPGKQNEIQPEHVMYLVDQLAHKEGVFTVDTGMTCVWAARYLHAGEGRQMLGSFNHGSMANALPQAIGAALRCPDRQVVALCGDGGLSMCLGDLATVMQYKLPVKIIVFNNRSLGMVKLEMAVAGLMDTETDMQNPDFVQVAASMGIEGITVRDPQQLETALKRAFSSNEAILVNVMTNPDALAMPPKVEAGQMKGFAEMMYKMLIHGRTKEFKEIIADNYKHLKEAF